MAERFARLAEAFNSAIEEGDIPGAALHVTYGDERFDWMGGYANRDEKKPLKSDTIFRIASMAKTVTSVLAMTLLERGKLELSDPISKYFPTLANLTVGVPKMDYAGNTVLTRETPLRPITIHDLLRHTSGFTYGQFNDSPVQLAYRNAEMSKHEQTTDDILRKLADLPLMYHPGTTLEYGMSTDVLGWLIEKVADRDLDTLLQETIVKPLGLSYMGFWPNAEQIARIAQPQVDRVTGEYPILGSRNFYEAGWVSGGHGIFTTMADYARYGQMLLNGGSIDGVRIIGRKTLAWMTSDHLPPGAKYGAQVETFGALAPTPANGQGFGLGFAVRTHPGRNPLPGSVGDFFWSGLSGAYFWADPSERLMAVLMMQAPNQRDLYRSLIRKLVYSALD